MRGGWRLPVCLAVALVVHGGLIAAWRHASASGVRRPPPHRMAAMRLVAQGPVAQPQLERPEPQWSFPAGLQSPSDVLPAARPSPAAVPVPRAVLRESAKAPERPASAEPSRQVSTIAPVQDFLAPGQVDRIAMAFPSPDMGSLAGLNWSGIPIRLRLLIAASGQCIDVQVLRASEDAQTLEHVRRMFLATHFIPARRAGADVASYRDIELDVSDVK